MIISRNQAKLSSYEENLIQGAEYSKLTVKQQENILLTLKENLEDSVASTIKTRKSGNSLYSGSKSGSR